MRIALISDIHANLPAFEAVLKDMTAVDLVLCAGDIVGYYPDANEVCSLLRQCGAKVIRGNHDAYVLSRLHPNAARVDAYRTAWTQQILSSDNYQWLDSLPVDLTFRFDEYSVWVRHASPWDEESYLYRDSPQLATIDLKRGEILVAGHTHHSMQVVCSDGVLINPGSVGQPRDWNPMSSYAIFDSESGSVEFRRVCYDVAGLQRRLSNLGWDPGMIGILGRTR